MFKDDRGRWWLDFYTPRGKRRRKLVGASKREAEALLDSRLENARRFRRSRQVAFIRGFLLNIHGAPRDHKISYVKCECYIDSLKKYFGKTRLSRITSGQIEGYRLKILSEKSRRHPDRPVSHSTINRQVEILRTMLTRAVRWGLLTKNPAQQVEDFDEDNKRERFLSTVEIRQLLRVSKQTDSPILRFSAP
jgi:site-specific recombinase XerD